MAEKLSCTLKRKAGEARSISGRVGTTSGSRASQRRVCSDGQLEKRVAEAMNARGATLAPSTAQASRHDAWEQGVHPALMRELTAIWQQADAAYSVGGEWQRLFALGEVTDRLAVVISDAPALCAESSAPAVTDRFAADAGTPGPSDEFEALRELLELDDLRDAINGRQARCDAELDAMVTDYETRRSLAWARARRVVARGLASGQQAESPAGVAR